MQLINSNSSPMRRKLSARRIALLATTIAGLGAAVLLATPSVAPMLARTEPE